MCWEDFFSTVETGCNMILPSSNDAFDRYMVMIMCCFDVMLEPFCLVTKDNFVGYFIVKMMDDVLGVMLPSSRTL